MAATIGLIKMSVIGSHEQQFVVRGNQQLHLPVTLTYAASMYGVCKSSTCISSDNIYTGVIFPINITI